MKLNGDSSQYVPVRSEDGLSQNNVKIDGKEMVENDFHMAPLAVPEEAREEVSEKIVPMTPLRKFCFILSILQCVLFIIAFGWLIPCKLPRYINQPVSILNWSISFPSSGLLELMDVSPYDSTDVLILGFSGQTANETSSIQALNTRDGNPRWYLSLPGKPFSMDCGHLDVDNDGISDCVIGLADHSAHMLALNKSNRHIFWFLHSHQNSVNVVAIGKPIIGVDCDDDKVKEIIFPFIDSSGSYFLATSSGLTGQIRGTVNLDSICKRMPENVLAWNVTDSRNVVFLCNDGKNNFLHSVPATELCENVTNLDYGKLDSQALERFDGMDHITVRTYPSHGGVENLFAVTSSGRAVVLEEPRKIWDENISQDGPFSSLLSVLSVRLYDPSSTELLIASGDLQNGSNIIVLNSTTGQEIHRFSLGNMAVSDALSHRKSDDIDGVILRVLELSNITDNVGNGSKNRTVFYSEKFISVECFETGAYDVLLSKSFSAFCEGQSCNIDVYQYTPQNSASVSDIDGDGQEELVFFHRTYNTSDGFEQNELFLERLDSVLPIRSCTTCSCRS